MRKIKIGVVDDCEQYRQALTRLLNLEPDFEVIFQSENGRKLLEELETKQSDVVLLDIRMPVMGGIDPAEAMRSRFSKIKIIALSQYDIQRNIVEMNARGVRSFIGKNDEPDELFKAIRIVYDGGVYMTEKSATIIQDFLLRRAIVFEVPSSDNLNGVNVIENVTLTENEIIVLRAICKGLSSSEISGIIHKSPRTIEKYRNDLYWKFQVKSKRELIEFAYKFFLER